MESYWYRFYKGRWRKESTLLAFDFARKVCREAAGQSNHKNAKFLTNAKTIATVERIARADRLPLAGGRLFLSI